MSNTIFLDGLMPGNYKVQLLRPTHWGDQGVVFNGTIRVPQRSDVTAIITQQGMKVNTMPLTHHGGSYWDADCGPNGTVHVPNANGNGGFVRMRPQHPVQPVVCPPVFVGMHPDVFASALRSI